MSASGSGAWRVAGTVVNPIRVDSDTEHWAKVALDRMLALPGKSHRD
jgi:quinolinate synthase